MSKAIIVISDQPTLAVTPINLALIQRQQAKQRLAVFQPIAALDATTVAPELAPLLSGVAIARADSQALLAQGKLDQLLEQIVANYQAVAAQADLVLIIGVECQHNQYLAQQLNQQIAKTLAAKTIVATVANSAAQLAIIYHEFVAKLQDLLVGLLVQGSASADLAVPILANIEPQDTAAQISAKLAAASVDAIVGADNRAGLMSPPVFRHKLTELAAKARKRIVLPEGDEPRTVRAAAICAERGIATCVLLADPQSVAKVAAEEGVTLAAGIEIIDPTKIQEQYIDRFVELRKSKGLTREQARQQIQDNVVLATLMLEQNQVDGLVSGAVHTTANTIRPPLQLIKTAANTTAVSSVFFMLMPDQVYVFGDCAICPEPTAEQLAGIAIQSADSAKAFDIEPRVAMLSYSTGTSGAGAAVDKVVAAIELVRQQRPDILIDGPLQYDAAVMPSVAKSKAPNSAVAGKATVFIFPDLNAGNITYKAVQRSANLISIGPMLQGMRKPVNDLSRGALVDDIVYTIALTAIQAGQQ